MERNVMSVKIKKGKLTVTYKQGDVEHTDKLRRRFHPDLIDAFSGLAIHYGLLSERISYKQVKDIENVDAALLKGINVSGYSLNGSDENEGIVITGHFILSNGKALIVNTPFTRLEEDDKSRYRYMDELVLQLQLCEQEVLAYLDGKEGEDPQLKMFDEEVGETLETA